MGDYSWGIIGSGGIAGQMARTLRDMSDARLVGVASRTPERARAFGEEHQTAAYDSIEEMLDSGGVDAIYVASSNHLHQADAMAALERDIPVLCEKPLTLDAASSRALVETARARDTFLMEAMWMRFQPFWSRLEDLISQGAIGEVRMIRADFGIVANQDPSRRWLDPAQGGGALLDVGIYPLTFAHLLAGSPVGLNALGSMTTTGVDASLAITLLHPNDVVSVLDCSIVCDTPIGAVVSGAEGRIELARPFHHSTSLGLWRAGEKVETIDASYTGSGYRFEVEEVHRSLDRGSSESEIHPLSDTLAVMEMIDSVRTAAFGTS